MSPYYYESWVGKRVKLEYYTPDLTKDPEKDLLIFTVRGELRGVNPETGGVHINNEDVEDNPLGYYPSIWSVELLDGDPVARS